MKRIFAIIILLSALTISAQIKDNGLNSPNVKDGIVNPMSGNLFSFLNSENFQMTHSFNLSYSAFGGGGLALGVYTNSMFYKFNDDLNVQVDASIVNSPYSSFGTNFQNNINGIYLSRAAINYKPFKDVSISVQYRNLPTALYSPFSGYYNTNPFNHDRSDLFWGY